MKRFLPFVLILITGAAFFYQTCSAQQQSSINGAWQLSEGNTTHLLLVTNQYYSYTIYDLQAKKFIRTEGGKWNRNANGQSWQTTIEFNSADPAQTGKTITTNTFFEQFRPASGIQPLTAWKQLDAGGGQLNATWRIAEREQNGEMYEIKAGARKTIKIITGTRFQWAAINTETGEFFGTGGGTYSFIDGRYIENIEFFSRDSSRIGMKLSFDGAVKDKEWHHRGKSSKGDVIHEIWRKLD